TGNTGSLTIQDGSGQVNKYDKNISSPVIIEHLNRDVIITVKLNSVGGSVRLRVEYYEVECAPQRPFHVSAGAIFEMTYFKSLRQTPSQVVVASSDRRLLCSSIFQPQSNTSVNGGSMTSGDFQLSWNRKPFFGNGSASLRIFDYHGGIERSLLEREASEELPRYFQTQKSRVLIRLSANIQNGFLFFRINRYAVPTISSLCGGSPNNGILSAIVSNRNRAYSCFWQMQRLKEGPMWFESKLFQAPLGVAYLSVTALSNSLEKLRLSFAPEDMWSAKRIQVNATEMFVELVVLRSGLPLLFRANYNEPTYVKDMRSEVIGSNFVLNWKQGDMPYDFLRVSWQKDNTEVHQDVLYAKHYLSIPIERESTEPFKISVYLVNSNVAADTWTIHQPEGKRNRTSKAYAYFVSLQLLLSRQSEIDPILIVEPSYTSLSVELTNIYHGSCKLCFLWRKDFNDEVKSICQNNSQPDSVIRNLESGTAYHVTYQVQRQKRLLTGHWMKVETLSLLADIRTGERPGEIVIRWDISKSAGVQVRFTCTVNVPKDSQLVDCEKELPVGLVRRGSYVIPVKLTDVEYTIQYHGTGEQGQPIVGHPIIVKT
ncbi:hypothetical protein T265_12821, partial [Opisthorchis viverrini]